MAHDVSVAQNPVLSDEHWMQIALNLAHQAAQNGEVPVGAVVVKDGQMVGQGYNSPIQRHDPTAHAEMVAMREAALNLGNYRLSGCQLFVTVEPCTMCAGAIAHARFSRLIYGASEPRSGAIASVMQFLDHPASHQHTQVTAGVLAEPCAKVMRDFFKSRR
jgi:tRNA(adenine34) deaminase